MMHRLVRGRGAAIGIAALLAWLWAAGEAAAQDKPTPEELKAWTLRELVDLPPDTAIALSDLAAPSWWTVPAGPDLTFGDALAQQCGKQQPETQSHLEDRILALNLAKDLDAKVKPGQVLAVPFCLKVALDRIVTVLAGDNPSKILDRQYGAAGPKSVEDFFAANLSQYRSKEDFLKRLAIGDQLVLPYPAKRKVLLEASASLLPSADEIVASIEDPTVRSMVESNLAKADLTAVPPQDNPQDQVHLFYIGSVDLASAPQGKSCRGTPDQVAVIADEAVFAERMKQEMEARKAFNQDSVGEPTPTTIGLVDSGLGTIGDDFFLKKLFVANPAEAGGKPNEDDDIPANDFNDDVYGINIDSPSADSLKPLRTEDDRAHGTEMAALALGGLTIGSQWNAARPNPLIKLKIVNFTSREVAGGLARPDKLPAAVDYLTGQGADIISLSLGTSSNLIAVETMLKTDHAQTLFTVAAGNEPAGGKSLDSHSLYPASSGGALGPATRNTVVVGATDLAGERAYFSNFSKNYVDLLAPGCAVQTRDETGKNVVTNGTSAATAITAFAAGIIHSLGIRNAWQVKNRLLVGVDYDADLEDDAWASGRLNLVKAVTLYHDVIDLNGSQTPLLDTLAERDALFKFCGTPPDILPNMIRKMIPNLAGKKGLQIEFWFEKDKRLLKDRCDQTAPSASIGDLVVDGHFKPGPALSEVKEITLGNFVRRP